MQGKEGKYAITAHCCCLLSLEFQCQRKGFVSQMLIVSHGNYNTGILKERRMNGQCQTKSARMAFKHFNGMIMLSDRKTICFHQG